MNKFKENLRVENINVELVKAVEDIYNRKNKKLDYKDKVALSVYKSIMDIKPENAYQEYLQGQYLKYVNKIICYFEDVEPKLEEFFEKEK